MTRRQFAAATFAATSASAATPASRDFFYKPAGAWPGDFIPLFAQDRFNLFYLHDWRDKAGHGEGTPWYLTTTRDFVRFEEHGEMLARGTAQQQDLYVFTGSALQARGQYHIFYTGHNPYLAKSGKPQEAVMHAVSEDLLHWRKLPEHSFFARPDRYEPDDWRDPFVFWNQEANEYWMLTAARLKSGPSRRRGCTALSVSKDLVHWDVGEPLWAPGLYFTHECPDLFRIGEWWYLVFSEFSEAMKTRYVMSRSLKGPWRSPANDSFDGRAYYAAKTASDGRRRYAFGWNPTRERLSDKGSWNWGGNLVVHEVFQQPDGTLAVRIPASVDQAFARPVSATVSAGLGKSTIRSEGAVIDAPGSFGCVSAGTMPERVKIQTTVEYEPGCRAFGIVLRSSADFESGYYLRFEPDWKRLVFDSWPRAGDLPFQAELERPIALAPHRPLEITVLVDGSVCVVYAGGSVAMCARLYNHAGGQWGAFVEQGRATFGTLRMFTP